MPSFRTLRGHVVVNHQHSDVLQNSSQWHHTKVIVSQITGNSTFVLWYNDKENIKAPHHWTFGRVIHWSSVDYPSKGVVMLNERLVVRERFSRHIIMFLPQPKAYTENQQLLGRHFLSHWRHQWEQSRQQDSSRLLGRHLLSNWWHQWEQSRQKDSSRFSMHKRHTDNFRSKLSNSRSHDGL